VTCGKNDIMGEPSETAGTKGSQKKPYESPRLIEYGRVADLVAGGVGSSVEGNPMQMAPNKRP
jgi:hypothetical protein